MPNTKDETELLTEFTVFPNLPSELRIKIWEFAEPAGRIVDVFVTADKCAANRRQGTHVYQSRAPQPITLHICKESRIETLKRYKLLFQVQPNVIYFNPAIDTLYLHRCVLDSLIHSIPPDIDIPNLDVSKAWSEPHGALFSDSSLRKSEIKRFMYSVEPVHWIWRRGRDIQRVTLRGILKYFGGLERIQVDMDTMSTTIPAAQRDKMFPELILKVSMLTVEAFPEEEDMGGEWKAPEIHIIEASGPWRFTDHQWIKGW